MNPKYTLIVEITESIWLYHARRQWLGTTQTACPNDGRRLRFFFFIFFTVRLMTLIPYYEINLNIIRIVKVYIYIYIY